MDQIIKLVDENGIEKEFRYLFAVTRTQTDVPYAFFMETNATRPEVVVYKFDEEGKVHVKLTGACGSCPMATMTLKSGVEVFLKENIPEVTEVVQVF